MILIIYNDKFPKIYVKISAKITFQPRCIHTHTTPYLNIHEILNRLGRSGIFRILSGSNPSNLARGEIAATHMGTGHYLKHRAGCCWVTSSGQPQQNTLPLCKAEENFAEPGSRQLVVYHASCNLFACVSLSLSLFPFAGSSSFFFRAGWLTQLTGASNEWCVCVCVCICAQSSTCCKKLHAGSRPPSVSVLFNAAVHGYSTISGTISGWLVTF